MAMHIIVIFFTDKRFSRSDKCLFEFLQGILPFSRIEAVQFATQIIKYFIRVHETLPFILNVEILTDPTIY